MEEELAALASASDLLSLAPDDEVVGELLQAHGGSLARALDHANPRRQGARGGERGG